MSGKDTTANFALQFILLMGFVSLVADITYEGAHSITGPYLGVLGSAIMGFLYDISISYLVVL